MGQLKLPPILLHALRLQGNAQKIGITADVREDQLPREPSAPQLAVQITAQEVR